jgi:CYTH domain-containing protein
MAKEIERKFLVNDNRYRQLAEPLFYRQGYLSTDWHHIVRVRIKPGSAFLAVKGTTNGVTRTEYEYEIPISEAEHILAEICQKPIIEKDRYNVIIGGLKWDIDEFHGANEGLVIAEVELEEENQQIKLPEWVGQEVSHEPKYYNSNLVQNPYCKW